jgi:hypothetical protein
VGEYVYLVGGQGETLALDSTVRARILADGTLEDEDPGEPAVWKPMTATLTTARYGHVTVAAHVGGLDYLYAIGGQGGNDTVERSEVLAGGSLGSWEEMDSHLVGGGQMDMAAYVAAGYIYVVDGGDNVVQRAAINTDGTLEPFSALAQTWPTARPRVGWVVAYNTLYLLGGGAGGADFRDTVDAAPLATDGSPQWATGPSLNVPRQHPDGVVYGGRLYAVGGWDGSASGRTVEVLATAAVGGIAEHPQIEPDGATSGGGASTAIAIGGTVTVCALLLTAGGAWGMRRRRTG